jgi:hypothetical protein
MQGWKGIKQGEVNGKRVHATDEGTRFAVEFPTSVTMVSINEELLL